MLQDLKELYGRKLAASDGDTGHVADFYFDDKSWVVRYVVADTGTWLAGRKVLLTPHAFGPLEPDGGALSVNLTRKQIENSPSIDLHKPISRQYEIEYYRHFGWPTYWAGDWMWGISSYPVVLPVPADIVEAQRRLDHKGDQHLRSARAVDGYQIEASDGVIGHLSSFRLNPKSWEIREVVVETGHWHLGKTVLILPRQIDGISYQEGRVFVNLTKDEIQRTGEEQVAHAGARTP